jgi:hypothetical protein
MDFRNPTNLPPEPAVIHYTIIKCSDIHPNTSTAAGINLVGQREELTRLLLTNGPPNG